MNATTRMVATAALMLAVGAPISAQARQQGPRALQGRSVERGAAPGLRLAGQIQSALRSQQALGLEADQVSALEEMRSELERMAEAVRLERAARRSEARERPESTEERIEQRRMILDEHRAERARTDTLVADIQARFEATVPPLQRQEAGRDQSRLRRFRTARSDLRIARGGGTNTPGRGAPAARATRRGPRVGDGFRGRDVRPGLPVPGDRWGR